MTFPNDSARLTSFGGLDSKISSRAGLIIKLRPASEAVLLERRVVLSGTERVVLEESNVETGSAAATSCPAFAKDFSRLDRRVAMPSRIVFLVRRIRGPGGGYAQGLPTLSQDEHG